MTKFKNIKEAHYYYKFPGSYRVGTIIYDNSVLRLYSNGTKPDYFNKKGNNFYYLLKNDKIREDYINTKLNNKSVFVFTKTDQGVINHGKFKVKGLRQNKKYVLLDKI